jgi:viologen exporter family transport system permease protein
VVDLSELGARLGTYRRLVGAQVRGHAAYRASFAFDLAANAVVPVIDLIAVVALFQVTRTLGQFTTVEVVVMFGFAASAFALADLVVGNIERVRFYVRQGWLDAVLVRPLSALGQLLAMDFSIRRVARLAVGLTVLGLAVARADVQWSAGRIALLVAGPVFGAVFFGAVFVATATVAFWWVDSGEFANAFTYGGRDFTSYPITVYSEFFRRVFAYSLGFAFVAYYPTLALLGRPDPLGLPSWVGWLSPLVCVVAAVVAALLWRVGIRHYRSTGS